MTDAGVNIAFYVIALVVAVAAIGVVTVRNVVHAVVFLVGAFAGVAGLFFLLQAEFVAAVQILIYAGAVTILVLFAIMLTRNVQQGSISNRRWVPVLLVSSMMLVVLIFVATQTAWPVSPQAPAPNSTLVIGDALFNRFVLPFEVASVLLLAAMIGAIVLARED